MIVDELVAETGWDADAPLSVDRVSKVPAEIHTGPANLISLCDT